MQLETIIGHAVGEAALGATAEQQQVLTAHALDRVLEVRPKGVPNMPLPGVPALDRCPFCGTDAFIPHNAAGGAGVQHPGGYLDGSCIMAGWVIMPNRFAEWNRRWNGDDGK